MGSKDHLELKGTHAPFSPSQPSWLNYTPEKLLGNYVSGYATMIGTLTHEFAEKRIKKVDKLTPEGIDSWEFYLWDHKVPEYVLHNIDKERIYGTLLMYVNDCIDFGMEPEKILYFSDNFYGTADAISFKRKTLRISDLKTGTSLVKDEQLLVYAAFFCLENKIKPKDIKIELRFYKELDILYCEPEPEAIESIMQIVISHNKILQSFRNGGLADV